MHDQAALVFHRTQPTRQSFHGPIDDSDQLPHFQVIVVQHLELFAFFVVVDELLDGHDLVLGNDNGLVLEADKPQHTIDVQDGQIVFVA